jgi:hypothetical protein
LGGGGEGDKDIDIAVGAEVVAQDGTKERELSDLPALAEPRLGRIAELSDFFHR